MRCSGCASRAPRVKVVLLRSGKNRGVLRRRQYRCWPAPPTAHKVNFCKFTNEICNGLEDSQREFRAALRYRHQWHARPAAAMRTGAGDSITSSSPMARRRWRWPVRAAAGGAAGHRRPDPRGRQAQRYAVTTPTISAPSRKASRASARCSGGWSTKSCPTASWRPGLPNAAGEFAAASETQRQRCAFRLSPLKRSIDDNGIRYGLVSVDINRADRIATISIKAPDGSACRYRRHDRAGVNFRSLQVAQELDDAILHLRINELKSRCYVCRTAIAPRCWLTTPFLEANKAPWLVNEIRQYWKRVLKRVDVTAYPGGAGRAGLVLRRYFGGTIPAADRSCADRPEAGRQPRTADDRGVQ